jgi:hypothetical protein
MAVQNVGSADTAQKQGNYWVPGLVGGVVAGGAAGYGIGRSKNVLMDGDKIDLNLKELVGNKQSAALEDTPEIKELEVFKRILDKKDAAKAEEGTNVKDLESVTKLIEGDKYIVPLDEKIKELKKGADDEKLKILKEIEEAKPEEQKKLIKDNKDLFGIKEDKEIDELLKKPKTLEGKKLQDGVKGIVDKKVADAKVKDLDELIRNKKAEHTGKTYKKALENHKKFESYQALTANDDVAKKAQVEKYIDVLGETFTDDAAKTTRIDTLKGKDYKEINTLIEKSRDTAKTAFETEDGKLTASLERLIDKNAKKLVDGSKLAGEDKKLFDHIKEAVSELKGKAGTKGLWIGALAAGVVGLIIGASTKKAPKEEALEA